MAAAPFFSDVAMAPEGAHSTWLKTADGIRIRVAHWAPGKKGTVLLFPGRTEYVEKYGPTVGDMSARGYGTATIDWRGQGLADRLLANPQLGHVESFTDYQNDVAAMLEHVRQKNLPEPFFLIAHSMGGCIGLRALHDRLPVRAAVFSAPMWGIRMAPLLQPVAWALTTAARAIGQDHWLTPGTSLVNYVLDAPFEENVLTSDPKMYAFMQRQLTAHPDLGIGGPSLRWLHEAMIETRALARMSPPACPCLTVMGQHERVVNVRSIHRQMARWTGARLEIIAGAEHEVMMEAPEVRAQFLDVALSFFDSHSQ